MSLPVLFKLLAIFLVVALGYLAGRLRWLGENDPARVLGNAAFYLFVPALLFRTTSRLDLAGMPWGTLLAFFAPVLVLLLSVYAWQRPRVHAGRLATAAPSVRAISASFGNTVQVGIPLVTAVFGEAGLEIHVAIVSLHALTLLTVLTALVELDLAHERVRQGQSSAHLGRTLARTARNTIVHPVTLPVLAGLAWNLSGLAMPAVLDEVLVQLGLPVVPLCLVLIGMSLAYYGVQGAVRGAVVISVLKLLVLPALVLVVGHWGFGLAGLPLAVVVMAAALPIGSNALIFAQRYAALEAETTAAIVLSTCGYMLTAPLWLWLPGRLA
ncbi:MULTISPECIES: AEC family transporter [unclassified Rhizobacter]|uniref:AEC family transporter n=1 Tax=unclassified Rhizobacter TaxID=2640088 RepID=UPI0006FABD76|nr:MULTISPECIES: AEC family transporter [unclassified Rhizobacter]KQU78275.1 transporter [Rhizobacter sp. Root29]KQW16021.1 transporter [Rhizobacter sp. Root1238]KRB25139.1 transporter [Rhizobacter sp. Root16D2]